MSFTVYDLEWYRVKAVFIANQEAPLNFSAFQAIIKGSYLDTFEFFDWDKSGGAKVVFHIKGKKFNYVTSKDELIPIEIMLCSETLGGVQSFIESLKNRMNSDENSKYYSLLKVNKEELRNYNTLLEEFGEINFKNEICMNFLMPFNSTKINKIYEIDNKLFVNLIENRIYKLFGGSVKFNSDITEFTVVPFYLNYTEVYKHNSKSQEGTTQLIHGYFGKLFIKGNLKNILPFILLSTEFNFGDKFTNSLGYFGLSFDSYNYFDAHFISKNDIMKTVQDIAEQNDNIDIINKQGVFDFNEKTITESIIEKLNDENYIPTPNKGFFIQKQDGSNRLVEQLNFDELVISKYILYTLNPVFDKIFKEESIGFRKGISRLKAEEMIYKAIDEGYNYVIETDIENFFPSIDLDIMKDLIFKYIPNKDVNLLRIILKLLSNGYEINDLYYERKKGLCQGSPLSPLFANLYLNSFDDDIKKFNVRLIRYADDFVILTKSQEEAEDMLTQTESCLDKYKLKIKKQKTAIRRIDEGFTFLGINFSTTKNDFNFNDIVKSLKKPLYITEPYVFLSLNNETIAILKDKKIIEAIPLKRISEIIIMNNVSFSNSLVKKCCDYNIPITMTLNTGYFVNTIKPNLKSYFEISHLHHKRYESLDDKAKIAIAKEFVANKVLNYVTLFKQKYIKNQNIIIEELNYYVEKINECKNIDQAMGFEGITAKAIFKNLNNYINDKDFHITKRMRFEQDYINSLLNYGYYLLFTVINTTLRNSGLNPYLGFLHSSQDNYESLVCDIQELFRAKTDRFIIKLINLKIIQKSDFINTKRGAYLSYEGKKKFLNYFEGEFNQKNNDTLSIKEEIYVQISIIKSWVLENKSLKLYKWE